MARGAARSVTGRAVSPPGRTQRRSNFDPSQKTPGAFPDNRAMCEDTSPRQGERVLCIVDDDDAVRQAVALLLRTHGFVLRTYNSALGLLVDPQIDTYGCLILDMHMPAMTGLEALEILRRRHVGTPAILLTGLADPLLADRLSAAGAVLLDKPVSEEQLLAAVTKACSGSGRGRLPDNT